MQIMEQLRDVPRAVYTRLLTRDAGGQQFEYGVLMAGIAAIGTVVVANKQQVGDALTGFFTQTIGGGGGDVPPVVPPVP